MTLDEAIEICEEKSKEKIINLKFSDIPMTKERYKEHMKKCDMYLQLAEWLKELKVYKEQDKAVAEAIEQGVVWDSEQHNWLEQIKKHIGICSSTRSNDDIITNILFVLEKIGLIKYRLTSLK